MNRIFEQCIKDSKALPDFSQTDEYQVSISLMGEIQDPRFIKFLESLGNERQIGLSTADYLVLNFVRHDQAIPTHLRQALDRLIDFGAIETMGRGRGTRYLLGRGIYRALGRPGTYRRKRGLDRQQNKMLLLEHIKDSGEHGSPLDELVQVVPALGKRQIQSLISELRSDGLVVMRGARRWARWVAAP